MRRFEQRYDLMSTRRIFAASVLFLVIVTGAYIALSCFEPKIDVSCERTERATCTLREYTWLSSTGPVTVDLETTTFEVDDRTKTQRLQVRRADGSTAFPSGLSNASAREVKRELDAFRADTSDKTLTFHAEFPAWIFLVMVPVLLPLTLLPSWILGGKLLVTAEPGQITVTRLRPFWKRDTSFTFPPGEAPVVEAKLLTFNRRKRQGALHVKATTGATMLVTNTLYDPLTIVADDVNRWFQRDDRT